MSGDVRGRGGFAGHDPWGGQVHPAPGSPRRGDHPDALAARSSPASSRSVLAPGGRPGRICWHANHSTMLLACQQWRYDQHCAEFAGRPGYPVPRDSQARRHQHRRFTGRFAAPAGHPRPRTCGYGASRRSRSRLAPRDRAALPRLAKPDTADRTRPLHGPRPLHCHRHPSGDGTCRPRGTPAIA